MKKVIIIDVDISNEIYLELMNLNLELIDARKATKKILSQADIWSKFDTMSTLIVFPGNGANIVRSYIPKQWLQRWQWISVYAKRYWEPGNDPYVVVNHIFKNKMVLGIKNVLVIDDVVSSGLTAKLLRFKNMPWIPQAQWHLFTWVAQTAVKLKGYTTFFAVEKVGAKNKKVPINSLSTLLDFPKIAESYCHRYFINDNRFEKILKKLRNI